MIDNYPFVAKRRLDQVYKGRGLRSWHRKLKQNSAFVEGENGQREEKV